MRAVPAQVDTHGQVSVAAVRVEAVVPEGELHQRDVGRVHALQGDAGRADVPARLRDKVFQSLQHLLQDGTLHQASLEHGCCAEFCCRSKMRKNGETERSWPSRRHRESVWSCLFVLRLASSSSSGSPAQQHGVSNGGKVWAASTRESQVLMTRRRCVISASARSHPTAKTLRATAETVLQRTSLKSRKKRNTQKTNMWSKLWFTRITYWKRIFTTECLSHTEKKTNRKWKLSGKFKYYEIFY